MGALVDGAMATEGLLGEAGSRRSKKEAASSRCPRVVGRNRKLRCYVHTYTDLASNSAFDVPSELKACMLSLVEQRIRTRFSQRETGASAPFR